MRVWAAALGQPSARSSIIEAWDGIAEHFGHL